MLYSCLPNQILLITISLVSYMEKPLNKYVLSRQGMDEWQISFYSKSIPRCLLYLIPWPMSGNA